MAAVVRFGDVRRAAVLVLGSAISVPVPPMRARRAGPAPSPPAGAAGHIPPTLARYPAATRHPWGATCLPVPPTPWRVGHPTCCAHVAFSRPPGAGMPLGARQ